MRQPSARSFAIRACALVRNEEASRESIEALQQEFTQWRTGQTGLSRFDSYALDTVKDFISNCYFSIKLRRISSLDEFYKLKKRIEAVQSESGLLNYHPFEKLLESLERLLNEQEKGIIVDEDIEAYSRILEKYISHYKNCVEKNFYPFQLPVADCIAKGGIFVASSAARPLHQSS